MIFGYIMQPCVKLKMTLMFCAKRTALQYPVDFTKLEIPSVGDSSLLLQ